MNKGFFITVEGGDGAGKSTLITNIKKVFDARKIEYLVTREPGGTPVAEEIRETLLKTGRALRPLTELFLYEAARAEHVDNVITPALVQGKAVICDRFTHSSLAYQGFARSLGIPLVEKLNDLATSGLKPDLVIFLKISVEEAKKRMSARGGETRLDLEGVAFHQKVLDGFETVAAKEKDRFITLDASKKPDEIFDDLMSNPLWIKVCGK